jgi:NAD(P)-dependent dehydrogenase (short-subunit alcohol dehydrogenase family)
MKTIVVTGARGGMGRAFTLKAAERGYRVFALDITPAEDNPRENIIPLLCDITSESSLNAAAEEVRKVTDTVYAVVHFAGIYILDSLVEIPPEDYERIFRINVFGPYLVNRTFVPFLREGSRILMTTSELAPLPPLPFTGLYAVTKSALDRYAFSLLMELQLKGIYVSVIRPGAIRTKMIDKSTSDLERFCRNTKPYRTNAERFRAIVNSVESRAVEPDVLAAKALAIIEKRKPHFAYTINNNLLLKLTHICPKRLELGIVRKILN